MALSRRIVLFSEGPSWVVALDWAMTASQCDVQLAARRERVLRAGPQTLRSHQVVDAHEATKQRRR